VAMIAVCLISVCEGAFGLARSRIPLRAFLPGGREQLRGGASGSATATQNLLLRPRHRSPSLSGAAPRRVPSPYLSVRSHLSGVSMASGQPL